MASPVRVADIVPNLDPSRYRTGAAEIEALNKKLATSFGQLSDAEIEQAEAFARTRTEASAATTTYERLLARTDQVQAATNKANDSINRAARAYMEGKISIEQFVRVSATVNQQLDTTREKLARVAQSANDNAKMIRGYGTALADLQGPASSAAREVGAAGSAISRMEGTASSLAGRLGVVGSAMAALGPAGLAAAAALGAITIGVAAIIPAGEKVKQLEGALKVATGSAEAAAGAFGAIYESAQRMGAPIEASVQLFSRMSMASKELGASRADILKLTEIVQKLGMAGGASTQEAASGAQQFGQALASGVLQGDELRSIMENMPPLAKAIADGLGVSVGKLREMGAAGELTAQRIFPAILAQGDQANKLFAMLPDTVERAQARMGNAWDAFLARLDKAVDASGKLAAIYNAIAKALDASKPKSDNERLGELLAERDRLLQAARNRRGDLEGIPEEFAQYQPTFSNADTARQETEERKRLAEIVKEIADLEEKRDRALRGSLAEQSQLRQDAFKRDADAARKVNDTLDETLASYRQQTEQLKLAEIEQKKVAAAEKARTEYLKANGVASNQAMAALQVADPARAVSLTAAAEKAAEAAAKYAEAEVRAEESKKRQGELDKERERREKESWDLVVKQAAEYDKGRVDAEKRGRAIIEAEAKKNLEVEKGIAKLEEQARAAGELTTEQKIQQATLEVQSKLYDDHGLKIRDLTAAERDRIAAAVRLREVNEEQKKQQEEIKRVVDRTTDDIVKYGADAFADMFQKNSRGWRGMLSDFLSTFRAMIARMAAEAIIRPIVQPIVASVVGAVPGLFGLTGGTGAAGGATSGGLGSILSPITDILGMAKSFVGDVFGGVSSWVNNIGASLGFASSYAAPMAAHTALGVAGIPGGVSGTAMGTATNVGGLFGSTSFSGLLGAAGLGFAGGGLLASLIGGNQMGGSIGGGLGAGAGMLLAPLLGIGGPFGAIAGGLLGALGGSLFGQDEQRPLGNAQLGAVKNGRLTFGSTTTLDGYDNSREIAQMQQAVSTVNSIIDKFGLTLNEDLLRRGFEDTANPIGLIGKTSTFDGPKDLDEWLKRFFAGREGQSYLGGATGTLQVAFDRLASGAYRPESGEDTLKMLDFASAWDRNATVARFGAGSREAQTFDIGEAARASGAALLKSVADYIEDAKKFLGDGASPIEGGTPIGPNYVEKARQQQQSAIYQRMGLDPTGRGVAGPGTAMTGAELEIARVTAEYQSYQKALEATGLTAEQATAAINRGIAARTAEIRAIEAETNQRTRAALDQREVAARIGAGLSGGGNDRYTLATSVLAEQQRAERYDADAAVRAGTMTAEVRARLDVIQGLEREKQVMAQAVEIADIGAGQRQREIQAQLTLGRGVRQDDVEKYALGVAQWRELKQAEAEGYTAAQIAGLQYVQSLEMEVLAYQQAVRTRQREEAYLQRTAAALAGVLTGSPLAQQAQRLTEDIARQIAQAAELRDALDATDAARIKEIQQLEDSAVAAQRAAEAQQQLAEAQKAATATIEQLRSRLSAYRDQLSIDKNATTPMTAYAEARRQLDEQLALVRGGDSDAIAGIQQYMEQFRQASLSVNASTSAYQVDLSWLKTLTTTLPEQVDTLELIRRAIEVSDTNNVTASAEQKALLDQLTALSGATKEAIGLSARDAATQAQAAQALMAAQKTAVDTGNNLSAAVIAQIGTSNQQLHLMQVSNDNSANSLGYIKTSSENSATSLGLMAAANDTMTGVLNSLNGSLKGLSDLGSIMYGVGVLVADNTRNRQNIWDGGWRQSLAGISLNTGATNSSVIAGNTGRYDIWNAQAQWLWKITGNTGRTVSALGGVPQYAAGTDFHPGGMAYVHQDELINLPRGAQVFTRSETASMMTPTMPVMRQRPAANDDAAAEMRAVRGEVTKLRAEIARLLTENTAATLNGAGAVVGAIDDQGRSKRGRAVDITLEQAAS